MDVRSPLLDKMVDEAVHRGVEKIHSMSGSGYLLVDGREISRRL